MISNALFYEIIEQRMPMAVPLTTTKLMKLAQKCQVHAGSRVLDLSCTRGELLCQWSLAYHLKGTGVDSRSDVVRGALERANELEVWSNLHFVESDVLSYPQAFHQYNVVLYLGEPSLNHPIEHLMDNFRAAINDEQGGFLVLGQLFWQQVPSKDVCASIGIEASFLPQIGDLITQYHDHGFDVYDFMIADTHDWDAFYQAQWRHIYQWLDEYPDHPQHDAVHQQLRHSQQMYFTYERQYIGWAVFILPIPASQTPIPDDLYGDW